jgi:hypothetical protein
MYETLLTGQKSSYLKGYVSYMFLMLRSSLKLPKLKSIELQFSHCLLSVVFETTIEEPMDQCVL